LVYFRQPEVGFQAPSGLIESGMDVAVSPDGRLVATTSPLATAGCGELRVRRRDGATGSPVLIGVPGRRGQCGLTNGSDGVVFSPSGRILYLAAPSAGLVGAFRLGIGPDQITVGIGANETTAAAVGARRLAVTPFTPDGTILTQRASLYAVSPSGNTVSAFDVSETTALVIPPALVLNKTLQHNVGCVPSPTRVCIPNFLSPRGVATSPDGRNVYVAVHGSDRVKAFSRLNDTSEITELQDLVDNGNGGTVLDGVIDVAVSPDGRFVYAVAQNESAVTTFSRDLLAGTLTFVASVAQGSPGVGGLNDLRSVEVSPDGIALYTVNSQAQIAAFDRNTATGTLAFNRFLGGGFVGLANVGLAISPDSEHVYVQNGDQDSGEVYARESALQAFDTATGELRPGLAGAPSAAKLASVASGRAAFIRPSTAFGTLFPSVSLYEAASDALVALDDASAFANKLALSSQIMALAAPENLTAGDADGDGTLAEDTLVVTSLAAPASPPEIVGVDALDVGATDVCSGGSADGDACDDGGDCPGGTCQGVAVSLKLRATDFDGNADLALAVHRQGVPGSIEIGRNVVDFEVSGNLIAFRDSEDGVFRLDCLNQNEIPFDNTDGDCTDLVMRIYDLVTNQTIDTQQATIKCEQPGCEPGLPYKILGDSVAFLTREADQGNQDLDGDGDANDTVVQIFSVRSARTQIVKTFNGQFRLPPLPTTFIGAPIVYRDAFEGDLASDVNEDGDQSDVVVLVDGDQDGDGVFDSSDICVEQSDPDQFDTDEDGLGNACDPTPFCAAFAPEAPAAPPGEANACQDAVGKGAENLFKGYAKAVTSCLDRIASGKLAGPPDPVCRGNLGLGTPPEDDKTEEKIAAAVASARKSIEKKCDATQLTQIDACGSNLNALMKCLTSRAAFATAFITELSYGDVTEVDDPKRLACQKKIGKQVVTYTAAAAGAMRNCLDRFNDGKISGDSAALCLGSDAPLGTVPPTDPQAAMKLAKSAQTLREALEKPCEGLLPAPLDACGDDAASIAACNQCFGYRAASIVIEGSYGP
ncbi:MAG: hypothetical protein FJ144_13790, partial [Deltaproteobacteria bacterium]|nr:hypothetical protein [Deltaproteobacteria bacterium]